MKAWILSVCLTGCTSIEGLSDRTAEDKDTPGSERIQREELLGERGNLKECMGHFTIQSSALQTTLKGLRHLIDPMTPDAGVGAFSFTWYYRRLPRGCYVGHR